MVTYPPCFTCALYDFETDTCPAFPEGLNDMVLQKKIQDGMDTECANNISYKPINSRRKAE